MFKRITPFLLSICIMAIAAAGFARAEDIDPLTDDTFRELHRQLQPDSEEPWRTIPWKIAVLDAQRTAAKENKPIFIWAMDGHPLGCT